MEDKDRRYTFTIKCLADKRIADLNEHLLLMKNGGIPSDGRVKMWYYALLHSWCKKSNHLNEEAKESGKDKKGKEVYTVSLECGEEVSCLKCLKDRSRDPEEGAAEGGRGSFMSMREIREVFGSLDSRFQSICDGRKEQSQLDLVAISLHALSQTDDYQMLVANRSVNIQHVKKALAIIACAISFLRADRVGEVFQVMFLLCSNLNGFFFGPRASGLTDKGFSTFLVFLQSVANVNAPKFLYLLDVLCCLEQDSLATFVLDVAEKRLSIASLTDVTLYAFAKKSVSAILAPKPKPKGSAAAAAAPERKQLQLVAAIKPRVVFTHGRGAEEGDLRERNLELKEENESLKKSIEVLHNDVRYFNTHGMVQALKDALEECDEEIAAMKHPAPA